jgi:hypothetical protein
MPPDPAQPAVTATVGIDLASRPQSTAMCVVTWEPGRARVGALVTDVDDDLLVAVLEGRSAEAPKPSKEAVDAPLGWPVDFVRGVSDPAAWPVPIAGDRRRLERRATDHWVHEREKKQPLSVTTDRIGYAAMRAAGLLAHLAAANGERIDRSGVSGLVCETYPDPALRRLGLWPDDAGPRASYKHGAGAPLRGQIVERLGRLAPWLELRPELAQACVASDDCLDALVCALVARAAERALTDPPPQLLEAEARVEGWIHLPQPGALNGLV